MWRCTYTADYPTPKEFSNSSLESTWDSQQPNTIFNFNSTDCTVLEKIFLPTSMVSWWHQRPTTMYREIIVWTRLGHHPIRNRHMHKSRSKTPFMKKPIKEYSQHSIRILRCVYHELGRVFIAPIAKTKLSSTFILCQWNIFLIVRFLIRLFQSYSHGRHKFSLIIFIWLEIATDANNTELVSFYYICYRLILCRIYSMI